MPDTLQEAEEQVIPYSSIQIPRQQEKQTTEDRIEKKKRTRAGNKNEKEQRRSVSRN